MKKKKQLNMHNRRIITPYLYIAPVLIILLLMYGYPLIKSVIMSFQNYKLTHLDDATWNNFANYKKVFSDSILPLLFKNTLIYTIVSVAGQFFLGLGLALALNKKFKGRGIYQSIVFLPWAFSAFVVGLLFRW